MPRLVLGRVLVPTKHSPPELQSCGLSQMQPGHATRPPGHQIAEFPLLKAIHAGSNHTAQVAGARPPGHPMGAARGISTGQGLTILRLAGGPHPPLETLTGLATVVSPPVAHLAIAMPTGPRAETNNAGGSVIGSTRR